MNAPHTFHIPVMGLAFTVDSPLKVARYGISSVVSIVDDILIEKMREYYHTKFSVHLRRFLIRKRISARGVSPIISIF